jgi:hypothetical protein
VPLTSLRLQATAAITADDVSCPFCHTIASYPCVTRRNWWLPRPYGQPRPGDTPLKRKHPERIRVAALISGPQNPDCTKMEDGVDCIHRAPERIKSWCESCKTRLIPRIV